MSPGALAGRTYVALVHHPVYDRRRRVVTTAVTNLDIHDIARAAKTFGLAGYFVVTPIAAQRTLVQTILDHWRDADPHVARCERPAMADLVTPREDEFRGWALAQVAVAASIAEAIATIAARHDGQRPLVVATSAQAGPAMAAAALVREASDSDNQTARPLLILFGTGWGLAQDVLDQVDKRLAPIRGAGDYNHLSVRSATAIVLDRLFGDRDDGAVEVEGAREP